MQALKGLYNINAANYPQFYKADGKETRVPNAALDPLEVIQNLPPVVTEHKKVEHQDFPSGMAITEEVPDSPGLEHKKAAAGAGIGVEVKTTKPRQS